MKKKSRPRTFLDEETVQQAFKEYANAWKALLDEHEGYNMLQRHAAYLDRHIEELKARHKCLFEESKALTAPAEKIVIATALAHMHRDISNLTRASMDVSYMPDQTLAILRDEVKEVLKTLHEGDKAIFDAAGKLRSKELKQLYAKSSEETWARYAPIDAFYEIGQEFAINLPDRNERAYKLATIPGEIQLARWKFMLALVDAAYGIDIGGLGGESIGPNHLALLSDMFARLSDRERGADNEHMPFTHKYRHNPGIHSLHTVALIDKTFHSVMKNIDHDRGIINGEKEKYLDKLRQMRSRMFLTALVHDMGEIEGELSQGIIVAHMDADLKAQVKLARAPREHATFIRHLDNSRKQLHHVEKGRITQEPIADVEWDKIRSIYVNAYERSEKTDMFLGCLFKVHECMQSQQDYLRFQGKNGAKLLRDSDEKNKIFSVNYVSSVFYDADWDARVPGPKALSKLAEVGRDAIEIKLQRMLTAATEKELAKLMQKKH